MPGYTQLMRPHRRAPMARVVTRPAALLRKVARSDAIVAERSQFPLPALSAPEACIEPDPYVDYGRFLTPEGGILIVYKDLDLRLRHTLWRVFAWTTFTGLEGSFVMQHSLVPSMWMNLAALIVVALVNWLVVRKPVELYRRIEIRPDCLIMEGGDVFWRRFMESGWPAFRPDNAGNQVLSGIYGTRFVEYLTVRRFDEYDRMQEVLAAHLHDAMRQLWSFNHI
jgi:hypothetical protein